MKSSKFKFAMALTVVFALAFTGVASGKFHLTKQRAYHANLGHAKSVCSAIVDDPSLGTCTKPSGKCPKRLGRLAFSCTERYDLNNADHGNYACTDRTKVTLRRGHGVKVTVVNNSTTCFDQPG